jgi:hypothetical protein
MNKCPWYLAIRHASAPAVPEADGAARAQRAAILPIRAESVAARGNAPEIFEPAVAARDVKRCEKRRRWVGEQPIHRFHCHSARR